MALNRKIIHIVGDSKFGGGSIIVLRLAQMARQNGWSVDVLTTDPTFGKVLEDAGIGVVNLDVIRRDIMPLRDLIGLFRLYGFLRKNSYGLVHTHTSKAGIVGRLAARIARCGAVVHTVHGFAFHEESSALALRCYAFLERIAAHFCDSIVTVSEFHRQWALKLGIGDMTKMTAIPNGMPEDRVHPDDDAPLDKRSLTPAPGIYTIIATGRLARQKGLEYLIRAIPRLSERLSFPFRIVLAGDGPLRSELERMSLDLGVADKVKFLGFCHDIGNLLAASDVVVLPSLWEGLSISLIEAMAAGKPIVTTTIGSNREVTRDGEAAVLVAPKDVTALADAIVILANDKARAGRIAARARDIYLSSYTEERMVEGYRMLYLRLMGADMEKGTT
jgi:glycosyltransferase involved in cell wall biosynthesis